jgi:CheY-like chemotaxis protein
MCPANTRRGSIDVLIAEDDPLVRLAVRHLLEAEGYSCAEAEDGREAIEIAQQCTPRLVLLDLMMPGLDGFSTAEQLRSLPQTWNVPIHCLTALDFPAARRAAERSGCEAFLTKPFDMDGLLDVVSTALHGGSHKPSAADKRIGSPTPTNMNNRLANGDERRFPSASLTTRIAEMQPVAP